MMGSCLSTIAQCIKPDCAACIQWSCGTAALAVDAAKHARSEAGKGAVPLYAVLACLCCGQMSVVVFLGQNPRFMDFRVRVVQFACQFVHSKSRKSQISKSPSSRGPVRVVQFVHSKSRKLRDCVGIPKHESVGKPSGIQAIVRLIVIETVL